MSTVLPYLFRKILYATTGVILLLAESCQLSTESASTKLPAYQTPTSIRFNGTSYELLRYGKPYFIKGGGGVRYFDELKAAGGNSIRIWDDIDAERILDEAHALGLSVMFGLWVEREMEGFDYDNRIAVERQYERIRKTVLRYRNHPALLMWSVGNEWAQEAHNFKVYQEVNRLAELVHSLDKNHPVSTVISPDDSRSVWLVSKQCPAIDILGVNSYGLTKDIPEFFRKGGWTKPYIITEYGVQAYWETSQAPWGAPDEPDSWQKNKYLRSFYETYIGSKPANCLGAYLFYWGTKQEESHTWFSSFDEEGRKTPVVDLMQELWTGRRPTNQAPVIEGLLVDGQPQIRRSYVYSRDTHQATIRANDPDGDSLSYRWQIKLRAQPGFDYVGVSRPAVQNVISNNYSQTIQFQLPQTPGPYRLFIDVYDTHQHVSSANFSFEVTK